MPKMKTAFGYAVILWIVGVFPIIFDVLFRCLINTDSSLHSYEDILIAVCTLTGGLLCLFVADKECDVKKREHNWKILVYRLLFYVLLISDYTGKKKEAAK